MSEALRAAGSTRRWRRLRVEVLVRDGGRCQVRVDDAGAIVAVGGRLCLAHADSVDHIIPRALGGDDSPANLRAACRAHNLRKGATRDGEGRPGAAASGRRWSW